MTFQILGSTCFGGDHQPEVYLGDSKPVVTLDDDSMCQLPDSKPQPGSRSDPCIAKYVWYLCPMYCVFVHLFFCATTAINLCVAGLFLELRRWFSRR